VDPISWPAIHAQFGADESALEKEMTLRDRALSMQPRTLSEAAVQLGVLFLDLDEMTECELLVPMDIGL
jgi:hypothetical protein